MIQVSCPACQLRIELNGEPEFGQSLECLGCLVELEVIWLYPITLGFPEENISMYSKVPNEAKGNSKKILSALAHRGESI